MVYDELQELIENELQSVLNLEENPMYNEYDFKEYKE